MSITAHVGGDNSAEPRRLNTLRPIDKSRRPGAPAPQELRCGATGCDTSIASALHGTISRKANVLVQDIYLDKPDLSQKV